MQLSPIAILGAGSWGTALAIHLAQNRQSVNLWEFDTDQVVALQRDRSNQRYLSGFKLPDNVMVMGDMESAVKDVQDILIVVPSFAFYQTLLVLKPLISADIRIAWATKGIDHESCRLLHELVIEHLGERPIAVISGPSFAREVAQGLPTAVVAASNDEDFVRDLVKRFNHHAFRVYMSKDIIGVQLGGAIKNVIAIAVGASDGLHYGANAKSALVTRGLAEIMRLGLAMKAESRTFMGLSGLGDLVLTCTDNQSRNRRLGLAIAKGQSVDAAMQEIGQVVEGINTVDQVLCLAKKYKVEMPICQQVGRILSGKIQLRDAVVELLSRSPKFE
ncbi:MAG: NAD(P)H-dependent glycerol-3-phosphate dehydrogenase [Gammaproteobacteria bacterium]|jgi:glycerol-3-phosphate dehydrogenase (NAD(P)+)